MKATRRHTFAITALLGLAAAPGVWALVPGGGPKKSDCYLEYDGLDDATAGRFKGKAQYQCTDGASCDGDGQENGSCTFNVAVCVNQADSSLPQCTPQVVTSFPKNSAGLEVTSVTNVSTALCGAFTPITVAANKRQRVALRGLAPLGRPKADVDVFFLRCVTGTVDKCPDNSANGPKQIELDVRNDVDGETCPQDLDNGVAGYSHNFPNNAGLNLKVCLAGCDNSSNPICDASLRVGKDSVNGRFFGPPLPLIALGTPVCVVNRYNTGGTLSGGKVDVSTGEVGASSSPVTVPLFSDVFITSSQTAPCPTCDNGRCAGGARSGASCTVGGRILIANKIQNVSVDCPPSGNPQGTLTINLPLTTGTSTKDGPSPCGNARQGCGGTTTFDADDNCGAGTCNGTCNTTIDKDKGTGVNQYCCSNNLDLPCFPTAGDTGIGKIERTGQRTVPLPAWTSDKATYPKVGTGCTNLAATFCEAATTSNIVDCVSSGLPGPGALILSGRLCWEGNNGTACAALPF